MPLYEYHCRRCGHNFEVLQKFSDKPVEVHQECGGEVERLISPSAFNFKGKGWYVTDYGRNGKLPSGNGKSEGKSESKADSKSENKSEPPKSTSKPSSSSVSSEK